MTETAKPRLSIRKKTYRGRDGFLVCGHDRRGNPPNIFVEDRAKAEKIVAAIKRSDDYGQEVGDILMGIKRKRLEITAGDLNEEAYKRVLEFYGDDVNLDLAPLAILEVEGPEDAA